jgi:prepilin-type processing-associated H-X9-DG protein
VTDAQAALGMACTDSVGRMAAALGGGPAPSIFQRCKDVTFGGVLCALPALAANGLFDYLAKLPGLPRGFYQQIHIILLLAYMALCRIRTAEQIRNQPPGELGKLLGLDRIPEVRTLREKLAILGGDAAKVADWSQDLAQHWMQADPEAAGVLYVDGHVRVYHGELAVLPKRYVSREKLCLRGTTDYWVNDQIGQPYFVVSREFNEGLAKVLREQIVPRLLREVPGQPTAEQLAADPRLHRFLLVFDREGSSPAFFKEMWEQHRVACVSYRKQPLEAWDPAEFQPQEVKMAGGAGGEMLTMSLAERGTCLSNGLWVREVRKLGTAGHQTSLMSTARRLEMQPTAAYLFSRWSQENFIKYMMEHYAIDALNEYGAEAADETVQVMNPAWKQQDALIRSLCQKLQRAQVRYAAAELDEQLRSGHVERYQQTQAELREKIAELQTQLEQARQARAKLAKHIAVSQLPPEQKIKRLLPVRKQLMDTIKMIAYRAETALCGLLREDLGRMDDARPLVRDLFRRDANLHPQPEQQRLLVEIHHLTNPQADQAVARLLDKLNTTQYVYPGTNLTLRFQLVS